MRKSSLFILFALALSDGILREANGNSLYHIRFGGCVLNPRSQILRGENRRKKFRPPKFMGKNKMGNKQRGRR